jgi:hypothetical protein
MIDRISSLIFNASQLSITLPYSPFKISFTPMQLLATTGSPSSNASKVTNEKDSNLDVKTNPSAQLK